MIEPAVKGTTAIMKCALANKVKRVVITSSIAAIFGKKDKSQTHFTTKDWSELEACNCYLKAKTMAEKLAWDF